jgi:hypothetical protein
MLHRLPDTTPTQTIPARDVRPGDQTAAGMGDGTIRAQDVIDVTDNGVNVVISFSPSRQSVSIVPRDGEVRIVARRDDVPARYTDERLQADLTSDSRGSRREAQILLTVPAEGRQAVMADAWRSRNLVGGRLTDHLESAARAYNDGRPLVEGLASALDPRGL